jgi:hypothetical protein
MKPKTLMMLTREERAVYVEGLRASGYEVWRSYGDVEFVDGLAKPGKEWGDRSMSVQEWPSATVGTIVEDDGVLYRVVENVLADGVAGQYVRRDGIFARVKVNV